MILVYKLGRQKELDYIICEFDILINKKEKILWKAKYERDCLPASSLQCRPEQRLTLISDDENLLGA